MILFWNYQRSECAPCRPRKRYRDGSTGRPRAAPGELIAAAAVHLVHAEEALDHSLSTPLRGDAVCIGAGFVRKGHPRLQILAEQDLAFGLTCESRAVFFPSFFPPAAAYRLLFQKCSCQLRSGDPGLSGGVLESARCKDQDAVSGALRAERHSGAAAHHHIRPHAKQRLATPCVRAPACPAAQTNVLANARTPLGQSGGKWRLAEEICAVEAWIREIPLFHGLA